MTGLPIHQLRLSPFRFREEPCILVPKRSTLATIPPIGLGTRHRESLSSYLMRLADSHGITPQTLVRELMWPRLGYGRTSEADCYWQDPAFDTIGRVPKMWSQALTDLTGVKGLHRLTLLPLQGLIPFRQLAPARQRWCPLCVREGIEANKPYGQLVWNIDIVVACSKHGIRFVSNCGCDEDERIPHGRRKYLPYLCTKCGRILDLRQSSNLAVATPREIKQANLIGEVLESDLFEGEQLLLRHSMVSLFLQIEVEKLGNAALLARQLGTRKSCLHYWKQGRHLPSLPWVIRIAEICSVSIQEVLVGMGSLNYLQKRQSDPVQANIWIGSPVMRKKSMEGLTNAIQTYPPVKLSALCRELGYEPRVLRMMHPDLVKAMVNRWRIWSRQETLLRRQKMYSTIFAAAEKYAVQGKTPTTVRVTNSLHGKLTIYSQEAKDACKEICKIVAKKFNLGPPY